MATPNKKIVHGVEQLELAVIDPNTGVQGAWVRAENVAPGTVSYTSNADTDTPIIPEDKDVAIIVLKTPGDPINLTLVYWNLASITLLRYSMWSRIWLPVLLLY